MKQQHMVPRFFLPLAMFAFTWQLRAAEWHKGKSGAASHCTKNKEQISSFVFDAQTHTLGRPAGWRDTGAKYPNDRWCSWDDNTLGNIYAEFEVNFGARLYLLSEI
jgi:hypothetical protein